MTDIKFGILSQDIIIMKEEHMVTLWLMIYGFKYLQSPLPSLLFLLSASS